MDMSVEFTAVLRNTLHVAEEINQSTEDYDAKLSGSPNNYLDDGNGYS